MIKKMNVRGLRINLIFKHRWQKLEHFEYNTWKSYELGLWFKKNKVVSKPLKGPAVLGPGGKTSNAYMFGINLLVVKMWIDICYRPLQFEVKK